MGAARRIRVLAFVEAHSVTGPVKNLLDFCAWCNSGAEQGRPEILFASFARSARDNRSQFALEAERAGMPVHFIGERGRFDLRVVSELRRLVRDLHPDVIQTHSVKSHFLVRFSGVTTEFPWIAFHHGYTSTDLKMKIYNRLDRWSLPGASRVVTVCLPFAAQLERIGVDRSRIRILHNGIASPSRASQDAVDSFRARFLISKEAQVVLAVGRLSREKGHRDLVEAFGTLPEELQRKSHLLIVGDGPEKQNLAGAVRDLGLQGRVTLAGHIADASVAYSAASLFVLPSHSEGSPNVLLESMTYGLTIIACAVGGVPEIVEDGESALLVPGRAPNVLGNALATLLRDRELRERLGERAKERARSFAPEKRATALSQVYLELVASNGLSAESSSDMSATVSRTD